ncbi:MAG: hypothetical protein CUN54_11105, partial [Phototrophicales bacterium]
MPGEHILLIDSDRTAADAMVKAILQPKMYHTHCATTADEAFATMQRIKPDLILVSLDSTPEASLDLLRKLSSQ